MTMVRYSLPASLGISRLPMGFPVSPFLLPPPSPHILNLPPFPCSLWPRFLSLSLSLCLSRPHYSLPPSLSTRFLLLPLFTFSGFHTLIILHVLPLYSLPPFFSPFMLLLSPPPQAVLSTLPLPFLPAHYIRRYGRRYEVHS